ncbi:MAG: sigma-70 family RNA polymerase sigma factor [Kiritimatiellae bacterium]|nr:sigma-70 family RNA polymerase sigma factor [Kiritimatiellia bacterium]
MHARGRDQELLESYVRDKSEGAFRQIVERYGALVYSAAYRRLQDHHLAEDAAQATFIILAQKAHRLKMGTKLAGWLWRTALNCARNIVQKAAARARREERAAQALAEADEDAAWARLAPAFDEALATLPAPMRDALVDHYLGGKSQREIAESAGLRLAAVQKRVTRGLDRLRRALRVRGVAVPGALLASLAAGRTAEAVQTGFEDSLHAVAYGTVTGATAATHSAYVVAKGVMNMMAWTRAKITAAYSGAALLLLAVGAALAAGLINGEYRMPDEPRFAKVEYPRELIEAPAGFILDFYPDSWLKLDLSGTWHLRVFQQDKGMREEADQGQGAPYEGVVSAPTWTEVPVPYSLGQHKAASPDRSHPFRGAAWYRHEFTLPADWPARLAQGWRALLRFEAIGTQDDAEAWLNAQPVGDAMHGWNAFEFDVTDKIAAAGQNNLAVRLLGGGSGGRTTGRTGLWQPVRLICVPPIHAQQILVATPIDPPALRIDLAIANPGPALTRRIEAVLAPYNGGGEQTRRLPLGELEIGTGTTKATFRVKTPGVRLWSPDEPNLYLLTLTDGEQDLTRIRIGFRQFETRDGDFYLNGNKIKLMGLQLSGPKVVRGPGSWGGNHNNHARKLLYGLKQANINFGRPHAGEGARGGFTETLYNLCDEIGFLIYEEYDYSGSWLYDPDRLTQWGKQFAARVLQVHNHPACVMWDVGGNERYTTDPEMVSVLNYLYGIVEGNDLQRRPKTSSSGRLTYERLERFPELEKADFADSHRYNGYSYGSYQEFIWIFERHDQAAKKRYGPNTPTLNCEWGFPGDQARYRSNTTKIRDLYLKDPWGKKEKRQWIEYATHEFGDYGDYLRGKGNWAGGRIWATDPLLLWERKAIFSKRFFEVFRRAGDVIDGGHFNSPYYCLLVHGGGGHEGIHAAISFLGLKSPFPPEKSEFFKTPAFYTWRRVYSPTFVCLDIHDKNTFAGNLWTNTVHLMNDSQHDAGPARAVLQLRAPTGKLLHQECVWQGHLRPHLRQTVPVQLSLSSAWPTGRYALELYLLNARNAHLSDNSYPLHVVGRADLCRTIRPKGRVGLYEIEPDGDKKPDVTTAAILRALGIPHKAVKDLGALADLDVLVIGRESLDMNLARNGAAVTEWVRRGGRLLCLEQSKAGELPFLPEVKVVPGKRATFTELLVEKHPIFTGLGQELFDDWNGHGGLLFKNTLAPLNEGMLSVGPTLGGNKTDSMKMIAASYAVGKGEMLLSQYELTRRYGKDSVATRLLQNMLSYVMTQPRSELSLPFDTTATAKQRTHLEQAQACFVDLRGAANAGLEDLDSLPAGITTLAGDVPFSIIDPAQNRGNACIALRGSHSESAPLESIAIPVERRLARLYLLHYATWANDLPDGEVILTVRIQYADGREQRFPMRNRIETGDWWQAKEFSNAEVIYRDGNKSLFLTTIEVPDGRAFVRSLTFESAGKAGPIVLAVTGERSG